MVSTEDLSMIHEKDLYRYYQSLQTFFDVTGISHDRSKSVRAQKARSKLIKLSLFQFYELSTDVYDELNRRISEDQTKPNYLLPKSNFHLKRNQARQKLANLSQTRFNDLVDDILYEIKRRGLDVNIHDNEVDNYPSFEDSKASIVNSIAPNTTLQESRVEPKKASIAWSSDEDNEPQFEELGFNKIRRVISPNVNDFEDNSKAVQSTNNRAFDNFKARSIPSSKMDDILSNRNVFNAQLPSAGNNLSRDELVSNNADLKSQITSLNEQLKNFKRSSIGSRNALKKEVVMGNNFQEELRDLSDQVSKLSIENENLRQTISELRLASGIEVTKSSIHMIEKLKYKYPLDRHSVSKYVMSDGYIPINLIDYLNGLLNGFFEILIQQDDKSIGKHLFETLFQVSNIINQVLINTDIPIFKDSNTLLKASLSHLITSVRYYSVYGSIIPKITVYSAVTELSFALCNLISYTKLKNISTEEDSALNRSIINAADEGPVPITPVSAEFSDISGSNLSNISNIFSQRRGDMVSANERGGNEEDEISPVKPLKIIQKANQNSARLNSTRNISGAGLFSSVIDTTRGNHSNNASSVVPIRSIPTIERRTLKVLPNINTNTVVVSPEISTIAVVKEQPKEEALPQVDEKDTEIPLTFIEESNVQESFNVPLMTSYSEPREDKLVALEDSILDSNSYEDDTESIEIPLRALKTASRRIEASELKKISPQPTIEPESNTSTQNFTEKMKKFDSTKGIGFRMATPEEEKRETELPPTAVESKNEVPPARNIQRRETSGQQFKPTSSKITDKMKMAFEDVEEIPKAVIKITEPSALEADFNASPVTVINEAISEEESGSEEDSEPEFDVGAFDIENPDNSLSELLLYLEHQTVEVISTIQSLLSSIKLPKSTKGTLREESNAISQVIGQMVEATSISMNQSRNGNLKEHGSWVVQSLSDCKRRMTTLCELRDSGELTKDANDGDYADKHFKQRLAGIAFDVAKCTKELVKSVEEASLKEEIEYLNAHMK